MLGNIWGDDDTTEATWPTVDEPSPDGFGPIKFSIGDKLAGDDTYSLQSFSIDAYGIITGVYSDGKATKTHKIAQIAVAKFANDAGMNNLANGFMGSTSNSGDPNIGAAGIDGRAVVIPGALEMSNVDLSQEFTDMIVTQRGFQANSRVITVSDSLLQELIDLKRQ